MPFFSWSHSTPLIVTVTTAESRFTWEVDAKIKVRDLIANVSSDLGLKESYYFGLCQPPRQISASSTRGSQSNLHLHHHGHGHGQTAQPPPASHSNQSSGPQPQTIPPVYNSNQSLKGLSNSSLANGNGNGTGNGNPASNLNLNGNSSGGPKSSQQSLKAPNPFRDREPPQNSSNLHQNPALERSNSSVNKSNHALNHATPFKPTLNRPNKSVSTATICQGTNLSDIRWLNPNKKLSDYQFVNAEIQKVKQHNKKLARAHSYMNLAVKERDHHQFDAINPFRNANVDGKSGADKGSAFGHKRPVINLDFRVRFYPENVATDLFQQEPQRQVFACGQHVSLRCRVCRWRMGAPSGRL